MREKGRHAETLGAHVLVVDDDGSVRRLVRQSLEREGFVVHEAASGDVALEQIRGEPPDLLILDLHLPRLHGLTVLGAIREHSDLPVILLTGRTGEDDRVVGLDAGADDYVTKPFLPRELAARVRSVLRRRDGAVSRVLDHGALRIDLEAREATLGGAYVDLTVKEFDLLAALVRRPDRAWSREELLADVWDSKPEWQSPATVTEHVRRLRHKLGDDAGEQRWIVAVRGIGYRLGPGVAAGARPGPG